MKLERDRYINRELSWLSFNHRVLQEAKDPAVPLVERLRFLAIFSSNLDEYYRVRVATYRHLMRIGPGKSKKLDTAPAKLVKQINEIVGEQQKEFGRIFRNEVLKELAAEGIELVTNRELEPEEVSFVKEFFKKELADRLRVETLSEDEETVFLRNREQYLALETRPRGAGNGPGREYRVVHLPTTEVGRFVVLPSESGHRVIQLADVVRLNLEALLPGERVTGCFAVKLSRDAQLYLDDDFTGSVLARIKKSLGKRKTGLPSRFLYDKRMPGRMLLFMADYFGLEKADLVEGGRSHNFHEFFGFPFPSKPGLEYPALPALGHRSLDGGQGLLDRIAEGDHLLHFPYQSYDYVVRLLEEAAADESVEAISITLYRVALDSRICRALVEAARSGKKILVFDEVKARFDEGTNIYWGEQLEEAGARVIYSFDELKVHSKICLIERREEDGLVAYAYFGTGNFNEKTAGIYCDYALLTRDAGLTADLKKVFEFLAGAEPEPSFEHLLVAPFNMRSRFEELVDNEIANARAGRPAGMLLKMNSLEDRKMIKKLYAASAAGVKVRVIVRGICCLASGVEGLSENIEVTSIVDRYLEHGRAYVFENGGDELIYLASADWMKRNLSGRVEVGFPIRDATLRKEIKELLQLQVDDNTKARRLNREQNNRYRRRNRSEPVRAQVDTYRYLEERHSEAGLPQ